MSGNPFTRRTFLRGGAVGLALPWLETLASREAKAAGTGPIRRYMSLYFPNGTSQWWIPPLGGTSTSYPVGTTTGDNWTLSPILQPLQASKAYMQVLMNVGNYAGTGGTHIEPSHGNGCASTFTGTKANGAGYVNNGISVDQVIAGLIGSQTVLPSLQVGLSTLDSYCDGVACQNARSISWSAPTMPMYKTVNPQAVFDRLVTAGAPMAGQTVGPTMPNNNMPNPALAQTKALQKSVLDSVIGQATTLRTQLSMGDQARIDQYLTSVRDLEKLVAAPAMQVTTGGTTAGCTGIARPAEAFVDGVNPPDYSRETHSNLMIQLVTLAFACDITRTISFMLDDSRSDYVYSHVPMRSFIKPTGVAAGMGSSAGTGTCGGYHGLQHAGANNDGFATIIWWMCSKANQIAQALQSIPEGSGNVLDNTVITFCSGMNGGNHDGLNLPIALIGGGGGVLKKNVFTQFSTTRQAMYGGGANLTDLHLTLIQKVFNGTQTTFGEHSTGIIPELLA